MTENTSIPFCAGPDPNPYPPRFETPRGACDCHFHIFPAGCEHLFTPARSYTPPPADMSGYRKMAATLGLERGVLIQPSVYAEHNAPMLEVSAAAPDTLRAVVTVTADVTEEELTAFHRAGARGIRVNLVDSGGMPFADLAEALRFTARIAPLGWHLELLAHVEQFDDIRGDLAASHVPVVFGHLGYTKTSIGVHDAGYQRFLGAVASGLCWVKMTGSYRISMNDAPPYEDVTFMARALIEANPERLIWGSDWPHPRHGGRMPNDGYLLDQLADWQANDALRRRILVENPAVLYGF